MRVGEFKQFQATVIADDPHCMVLRPPDRDSDDLAVDAFRKAEKKLEALSHRFDTTLEFGSESIGVSRSNT